MELTPLPAFDDNYIWLLYDGNRALAVCPGDAQPIVDFCTQHNLMLDAVLVTHHHWDHVSGLPELLKVYPNLQVYAPDDARIEHRTHAVRPNDAVDVLGIRWQVLDLSGHTLTQVGYYAESVQLGESVDAAQPLVFSGDCIFKAGCGRLFEGTPEQAYASLQRIAALPDDTRIACTHEYSLANMEFVVAIGLANAALRAEQQRCQQLREAGLSTLPTTVALEKAINPFVRAKNAAEFAEIRRQKDNF